MSTREEVEFSPDGAVMTVVNTLPSKPEIRAVRVFRKIEE